MGRSLLIDDRCGTRPDPSDPFPGVSPFPKVPKTVNSGQEDAIQELCGGAEQELKSQRAE